MAVSGLRRGCEAGPSNHVLSAPPPVQLMGRRRDPAGRDRSAPSGSSRRSGRNDQHVPGGLQRRGLDCTTAQDRTAVDLEPVLPAFGSAGQSRGVRCSALNAPMIATSRSPPYKGLPIHPASPRSLGLALRPRRWPSMPRTDIRISRGSSPRRRRQDGSKSARSCQRRPPPPQRR
jgi:hypothetical protein